MYLIDTEKVDVTISSIAVVTEALEKPIRLDPKELENAMTKPLSLIQTIEGFMVTSQRDQVEAMFSGTRVDVRELSGQKEFYKSKIPTILAFLVNKCSSNIKKYGVNFIVAVPCDEPDIWLASNVLSSSISSKTGKKMLGGAAAIKLDAPPNVWTLRLEPGGDRTLNVNFNSSYLVQALPEKDELLRQLCTDFSSLIDFLNKLDT